MRLELVDVEDVTVGMWLAVAVDGSGLAYQVSDVEADPNGYAWHEVVGIDLSCPPPQPLFASVGPGANGPCVVAQAQP